MLRKLWTLSIIAISSMSLPACLGGIVLDHDTGSGVDGATVSAQECPTCPWESVVTSPGVPGHYKFDPYEDGPFISPAGVEAVQMRVKRSGYTTRYLFHKPVYDQIYQNKYFDWKDIVIHKNSSWWYSIDFDGDGLPTSQEYDLGTNPFLPDTDGDSIPDGWEVNGHDWVDYPSMGADPLRKNMFVECDYMQGQKPLDAAIQDVVDAFADAPVSNPDGSTGIDLHVEIDRQVTRDTNLSPVWTEFDAIKNTNFSSRRRKAFHYCVFAVNYNGGGSSGISRGIQAADFVVSLGSFTGGVGTRQQQAGTFMHELGHNLGLRHGGSDNTHRKPNYLSVMNYAFQMPGLRFNGVDGLLDYSSFSLNALNENNLNEYVGLDPNPTNYGTRICSRVVNNASGSVDWSGDGRIRSGVAADVNCDGSRSTLTSWNDWINVVYDGGGIIGPGLGSEIDGAPAPKAPVLPGDDEPCPGPEDLQ
jgi:hypothetical protein